MLPAFTLVDEVVVETFIGTTAYGDTYAEPVVVKCKRDENRKLVRNPITGEEQVSETTLYVNPDDSDKFTLDSKVSWNKHSSYVIAIADNTSWFDFLDHAEVNLN